MSAAEIARRIMRVRDRIDDPVWRAALAALVRDVVLPETQGDIEQADAIEQRQLEARLTLAIDDACRDCPRRMKLLEGLVDVFEDAAAASAETPSPR